MFVKVSGIIKKSGIPYQIVRDMHQWQLCHLAMVVPIADAYYEAQNPKEVWQEGEIMAKTAKQMKQNFNLLYDSGITLLPGKINIYSKQCRILCRDGKIA